MQYKNSLYVYDNVQDALCGSLTLDRQHLLFGKQYVGLITRQTLQVPGDAAASRERLFWKRSFVDAFKSLRFDSQTSIAFVSYVTSHEVVKRMMWMRLLKALKPLLWVFCVINSRLKREQSPT